MGNFTKITHAVQDIAEDQSSVASVLMELIQTTAGSFLETRVIPFGANQFLCMLVVQGETFVEWSHIAIVDTVSQQVEFFRVLGDAIPLVETLIKALTGRAVTAEVLALSDSTTNSSLKSVEDILALVEPNLSPVLDVGRTPADVFELVETFAKNLEATRSMDSQQVYLSDSIETSHTTP